jgi:hypothetical protein
MRMDLAPTQPPIQWVPRTVSLEVERPEAWSRPLASIYFRGQRSSGAIYSLPQYAFMAWYTGKAQAHIYFYLEVGSDDMEWIHLANGSCETIINLRVLY